MIQDLDRKVRTWYVPPNLQVPGFSGSANSKIPTGEVEQPSVQLTMQRYTAFAIKEMSEYISTLKFDNDELVTDVIFFFQLCSTCIAGSSRKRWKTVRMIPWVANIHLRS